MRGKPAEKLRSGTPQSVAEILRDHVVLELERIDRMYPNVYVPVFASGGGGSEIHPHPPRASGSLDSDGRTDHPLLRRLD